MKSQWIVNVMRWKNWNKTPRSTRTSMNFLAPINQNRLCRKQHTMTSAESDRQGAMLAIVSAMTVWDAIFHVRSAIAQSVEMNAAKIGTIIFASLKMTVVTWSSIIQILKRTKENSMLNVEVDIIFFCFCFRFNSKSDDRTYSKCMWIVIGNKLIQRKIVFIITLPFQNDFNWNFHGENTVIKISYLILKIHLKWLSFWIITKFFNQV